MSKYVLLRAYSVCRNELTNAVALVADATDNPALSGWAFELQKRDLIRSALEANRNRSFFRLATATAVKNNKLTFSPKAEATFDGTAIIENKLVSGTVIWCSKFNQGLYDAAFYFGKTLVTLQFTVADNHSLKLEHLRLLRNALVQKRVKFNRIVHLGIVKKEMASQFEFDRATGEAPTTRANPRVFKVQVDTSEELEIEPFHLLGGMVRPGGNTYCVRIGEE